MVEVGWVVLDDADKALAKAIRRARGQWARQMREIFEGFDFRVPLLIVPSPRREAQFGVREEPVTLLDLALQERDSRRWDAAFIITGGELKAYDKPVALGAPSAAMACAAVGAGRLDESDEAPDDKAAGKERSARVTRRIVALVMHLFGHLNGLRACADPTSFMASPEHPGDLEQREHFLPEEIEALREELADIADPRLEEEASSGDRPDLSPEPIGFRGRLGALRFSLRAAYENSDDVWRAVRKAQPWMLPLRLGRLTTAAASTLTILLMTAETWEASMSQPGWRVALLSLISLGGASIYLLNRQHLLIDRPRRRSSRLSEQRSVGNVAVSVAVVLGMSTTYVLLFCVTLAAALVFYPDSVIRSWAASVEEPTGFFSHLLLAGSVASLGLIIGALGASFEPQGYFRHVTYVDEEV